MRGAPLPAPLNGVVDEIRREPIPQRCPRCGSGDLFPLRLNCGRNIVHRAAYCAGLYDRQRRRFLHRSCGYSEGPEAPRR